MSRPAGLSKSRITLFEQCPKRLWLSVHRPELAYDSAAVRRSFDVGHQVGELAAAAYPDGVMISDVGGLRAALAQTSALLAGGWARPIFEATFAHDGVLIRADLMLPVANGWHVAEVKSTTGVKDYHLGDLATQLWVMRAAGVVVTAASIRHLDRTFVLGEGRDYHGLFVDTPLLDTIEQIAVQRPVLVAQARAVLADEEPVRAIGDHCDAPFTCSFKGYCGRDLPAPPVWPATLLPGVTGKKLARDWAKRGVSDLCDIPLAAMPNLNLARVHAATIQATVWHDRAAIVAEIADWAWPRTWLDFETIQFAVPHWPGTRPYEQTPFQFSAHVVQADGAAEHYEYLSVDGADPRHGCAEALAALATGQGTVIAWNAAFERGCLLGLAARFPDLAPALTSLADRLVDLLPVVRRHYYHRDMRGSWSIKAVLPTIAPELGYDNLDVRSGTDAQDGYLEAIDPATTSERRAAICGALLTYCRRDTEAMMVVLERLSDSASGINARLHREVPLH